MVDRILIYDDMDGFFDAYFFNEMVNADEVEETVKQVKKDFEGEWTLDHIRKKMTEIFNIKEVVLFDNTGFGNCCTIEVNKI